MTPQAKLWLGVALLFALMALAWTGMFMAASKANVQFIPVQQSTR